MAILDAILNISKRSMMPEWHQLDSSKTMPQQQESTKKKTLKSSSRSFRFPTGLVQFQSNQSSFSEKSDLNNLRIMPKEYVHL